MEKLNIRFLQLVVAAATVAFASPSFAGPYRMSAKVPIKQQKQFKRYVFGYGGWDSGAKWDTLGAFDDPAAIAANCPPGFEGHYGFDPGAIPIDWDLNNGWTVGGGVGYYLNLLGGSRFEIEGSYTHNEVGDLKYAFFELPADFSISTYSVMFNLLKEVPVGKKGAKGYFGGGLGYAQTNMRGDIDTIEYSDSDSGLAWQIIVGVDVPLSERLALFTQYRYLVLTDTSFVTDFGDFTHVTEENPASHAVQVGMRVSF